MSENQSNEASSQQPIAETNETFEVSTVESIDAVSESLLANYANSVVGDLMASPNPVAPEPADLGVADTVASEGETVVIAPEFESETVICQPVVDETSAHAVAAEAAEPAVNADAKPIETETAPSPKPQQEGFAGLGLSPEVQRAVEVSGYDKPTPIQAKIIPMMLAGRDVLAQSETGSGKTAAFALPILTNMKSKQRSPQVLVLTPTRELAIQVAKSFTTYAEGQPKFRVAAIYGGQDYEAQFKQLRRGVTVVVGTPGRVIDHITRGTLDLSNLRCLVLDEADEMLNMGFLEDVQFVLEQTPESRQIALFSATLPTPIREIASQYLNNPAKITIKKKTMTAESIRQRALIVPPREKIDALKRLLETEVTDGVIVFTKTKDATISVAEILARHGLAAVALNGDMPQKVRERTIDQLKSGHLDILVATDVAARGLDVTRVSHVFNFDLPHDSESYVHRIGRTGRAGRKGEAIILLTPSQRGKLRFIERTTKQPIEVIDIPSADQVNEMRIKRFKDQITEITAAEDLTVFKDLIQQYAEESGKPLEMIAAAIAQLSQRGRPFLLKDTPRGKKRRREDRANGEGRAYGNDRPRRERGNRPPREDREGFDRPPHKNGKGERQIGPPAPGMARFRINIGWRDGVKPGNIVGAIANEAGIDGEYIGPIKINDAYSTIDLPEGMPGEVYRTLRHTWVVGKQMRLQHVDDESDGDSRPQKKNFRGPKNLDRQSRFKGKRPPRSKASSAGKPPGRGKPKKRKSRAK